MEIVGKVTAGQNKTKQKKTQRNKITHGYVNTHDLLLEIILYILYIYSILTM